MALKRVKSYLLVAALAGGMIIGEGIGLYKLNQKVESLEEYKTKLEKSIDSMENNIKQKDDTIDNITKERDNITEERDSLQETKDKLEKENKVLQQKLEAKKQKEASAVAVASAEYPTQSVSRGISSRKGTPVTMTLTFYGDFASENGGYAGRDAQGNKLVAGTVASNVYSFGTQFSYNGQIFTVRDRGGSNFSSSNRLDVFVPRKSGESDSAYKQRIRQYGKRTVTMYKL